MVWRMFIRHSMHSLGMSIRPLKSSVSSRIFVRRLVRVTDVEKVDIIGDLPQKIYVEISHAKLETLGLISPQQIFVSVTRQNAVTPSGRIDTDNDSRLHSCGWGIRCSGGDCDVRLLVAGDCCV